MKALSLLVFIALFFHNSYSINIPNIVSSVMGVYEDWVRRILDFVLKKNEILELPKNVLCGFSSKIILDAIDTLCSAILPQKIFHPKTKPDIKKMKLQLFTARGVKKYPLLNSQEMARNTNFDRKKKVVFIVSGWMTEPKDTTVTNLCKAFLYRGDTNVVVLDNANLIKTLYTWSAYNTEKIGEHLAKSLVKLIKVVPVKNIHLIGHSLGGQIVGAAGRYFQKQSGKSLSHITGLDPANPCFNKDETLTGIYRGNADFVDIIHTNPGVFGQLAPLGDVDYYPGGLLPIKHGCLIGGNICSHERAWLYYTETVYPKNENNFLGTNCSSLKHLRQSKCKGNSYVMGFAVSHHLRGIFFSQVNYDKPYGNNAKLNNNDE